MTQKRKGSSLGHPQKDLSLVVTHAVLSLFCVLVKYVGFSYRSHSCCSWYAQLVLTVVVTVECYSPMIDWLSLSLLLYLSVTSLSLCLSHSHPVSLIGGCLNHLIALFISGIALCSFFFFLWISFDLEANSQGCCMSQKARSPWDHPAQTNINWAHSLHSDGLL